MIPDLLEQQLTNALTALSKQYEAETEQQTERFGTLQEQVQRLEEAIKDLKPQFGRTTERSPKCCAECEPYPAEAAARAGPGLWPQAARSFSRAYPLCGRFRFWIVGLLSWGHGRMGRLIWMKIPFDPWRVENR